MRTYFPRRLAPATAAVAGLSGATAQAESAPVVVNTARNAKLHHTALVNGAVGSLRTIPRPDGKTQVTYRGRPLYSVYQEGRGDANGEGFKDVGTRHAVVPSGR
jgi:predicted lipoprotein with Yx(FWY)xxD motif